MGILSGLIIVRFLLIYKTRKAGKAEQTEDADYYIPLHKLLPRHYFLSPAHDTTKVIRIAPPRATTE